MMSSVAPTPTDSFFEDLSTLLASHPSIAKVSQEARPTNHSWLNETPNFYQQSSAPKSYINTSFDESPSSSTFASPRGSSSVEDESPREKRKKKKNLPPQLKNITNLFKEMESEKEALEKQQAAVSQRKQEIISDLQQLNTFLVQINEKIKSLHSEYGLLDQEQQTNTVHLRAVNRKLEKLLKKSSKFEKEVEKLKLSSNTPRNAINGNADEYFHDHHDPFSHQFDCSEKTFRGHSKNVLTVHYDPMLNYIISGSADTSIRVWDVNKSSTKCTQKLQGHTGWIKSVTSDGRFEQVISGSGDSSIRVWDLRSSSCVKVLRGHAGGVTCVRYDASAILSGSVDKTIKCWDRTTGRCVVTLAGHEQHVKTLQFYSFALASCGGDDCINLWDLRVGKTIRSIKAHKGGVNVLQFDSETVVSGGRDGTIKLFDLKSGQIMHTLKVNNSITSLQFEGDKLLFSAERTAPVLYDLGTRQTLKEFLGHDGNVNSLCFHDDTLATGSADATVKLWKL